MVHLKWLQQKLGQTYSTWLLLKEGDELEYNNNQFVKNIYDEGVAEKVLLSKIMKNHKKSKDQRLRASSRGSGEKNVIFSNGPINSTSECSKLLY